MLNCAVQLSAHDGLESLIEGAVAECCEGHLASVVRRVPIKVGVDNRGLFDRSAAHSRLRHQTNRRRAAPNAGLWQKASASGPNHPPIADQKQERRPERARVAAIRLHLAGNVQGGLLEGGPDCARASTAADPGRNQVGLTFRGAAADEIARSVPD